MVAGRITGWTHGSAAGAIPTADRAARHGRAKARGVHDETVRVARRLHGQLAIVERTREVDAEEVGADVVPARDSEAVAQGPTHKKQTKTCARHAARS